MEHTLGQRATAEFVGAFTLVFVGAGSILAGGDLVAVGLAHGLAIGVMVAAAGGISGGHFNPAVTIGVYITNKIETRAAAIYIGAQLAGGVVAALLLRVALPGAIHGELGVPALGSGDVAGGTWSVTSGQAILIEAILTFFLVFVIFGTAIDEESPFGGIAALAIGLTITLDIMMGGPLTGAAMNPARWFGPALAGGNWSDALVYI
ncbi:MAG TPA: aquaporin, partial [Nitriliruptorales bacterium]